VLGRGRFGDLVDRQLALFESDEAALLEEADDADARWTNAAREETEELYGDYQLVVDHVAELLLDIRETYASALDEGTASRYRTEFNRAALRRFRRFSGLLTEDRS
jgi:hypothetical protein